MSSAADIQAWVEKADEDWLCVRNEMEAGELYESRCAWPGDCR